MRLSIISLCASLLFLASCGGGSSSDNGSSSASDSNSESSTAAAASAPDGQKIFRTYCITCHGLDGKLALNGAKDLSVSEVPLDERIAQITNGKNLMTPFKGILTEEEIQAVAEYTLTLKQ